MSKSVARKPGLQHHMGLNMRNRDFVACEQQRRRPACASAQTDQPLCYSLSEKAIYLLILQYFFVGFNIIKSLATHAPDESIFFFFEIL